MNMSMWCAFGNLNGKSRGLKNGGMQDVRVRFVVVTLLCMC
jgi:hypothetical protein